MAEKPSIEERENGPLIVKHLTRLVGSDGAEIEVKGVMALCRCGASRTKPFCDGSHKEVGFEDRGGRPEGPDRVFSYSGAQATVTFNPRLCAHAAECGRIAPEIFNTSQKPWVQPDRGDLEQIETVVRACPSGALQMTRPEPSGAEKLCNSGPSIRVQANGPYWVREVPPPVPPQGEGMSERKYVLCRCGKSGAKPYCDGTHREEGWSDG